MKNKSLRTFLSLGAAAAVVFFGSAPRDGAGVTNATLVLAALAGISVWFLTRPKADKPVS